MGVKHGCWNFFILVIVVGIWAGAFSVPATAEDSVFPIRTEKANRLIARSGHSNWLAIYWGRHNQFKTLDLNTGEFGKTFKEEGSSLAAALSEDGTTLVSAALDRGKRFINVYSTGDGKLINSFDTKARISWMKFSGPERVVAIDNGNLVIFDISTGEPIGDRITIKSRSQRSSDFAISRTGRLFASRTSTQEATVWQLSSGKNKVISTRTAKPDQAMTVYAMAFSDDESQLFLLGRRSSVGNQMQVFDLKSGQLVKRYLLGTADIFPMSKDTYEGPVVERMPDGDGWSLYGRTFLNSETGEVIEGNKGKINNVRFRKLVSATHQIDVRTEGKESVFERVLLPWLADFDSEEAATRNAANRETIRADRPKARSWKTTDGPQLEGEMVGYNDDGIVIIPIDDGPPVRLSWKVLSKPDREFAEAFRKKAKSPTGSRAQENRILIAPPPSQYTITHRSYDNGVGLAIRRKGRAERVDVLIKFTPPATDAEKSAFVKKALSIDLNKLDSDDIEIADTVIEDIGEFDINSKVTRDATFHLADDQVSKDKVLYARSIVFFDKNSYHIYIVATNKRDLDRLTNWAKHVQADPGR